MVSLPVNVNYWQRDATLDDHLDVAELVSVTRFLGDVKYAKELYFTKTDLVALFIKRNYKVHMSVFITSNMLIPTFSILDTNAGPSLVHMSFFPIKRRDRISTIQIMSPKCVLNSLFNIIGKVMLPVYLGVLYVRVHFGVVDKLAVPLLTRTSLLDRISKGTNAMERHIVPIQAHPGAIISKYTPFQTPCLQYGATQILRPLFTTNRTIRKGKRYSKSPTVSQYHKIQAPLYHS